MNDILVTRDPLPAREGLIRIGTRGSQLAVTQTTGVARLIAQATGAEVALVIITTKGDTSPAPLAQLGGTGVFVSALRDALIAGKCDLAVHSLKDLPTGDCPGITLGAIPPRVDPRDAFCGRDGLALGELPAGARVGTGSPRRGAQLGRSRPDLAVCDLRGNVDSRLARVGADLDGVVLAAAGLTRIGREAAITEYFPLETTPTAPGQGALAIESRSGDALVGFIGQGLRALDDADARACALAERAMLAELEAGCQAPVGAWARLADGLLMLSGAVYRPDGSESREAQRAINWPSDSRDRLRDPGAHPGPDATADAAATGLGIATARELLANGAAELAPMTLLTGARLRAHEGAPLAHLTKDQR